jgi:hypothetical protein
MATALSKKFAIDLDMESIPLKSDNDIVENTKAWI